MKIGQIVSEIGTSQISTRHLAQCQKIMYATRFMFLGLKTQGLLCWAIKHNGFGCTRRRTRYLDQCRKILQATLYGFLCREGLISEVTLQLGTRRVEQGEEELRYRTTINLRVRVCIFFTYLFTFYLCIYRFIFEFLLCLYGLLLILCVIYVVSMFVL